VGHDILKHELRAGVTYYSPGSLPSAIKF